MLRNWLRRARGGFNLGAVRSQRVRNEYNGDIGFYIARPVASNGFSRPCSGEYKSTRNRGIRDQSRWMGVVNWLCGCAFLAELSRFMVVVLYKKEGNFLKVIRFVPIQFVLCMCKPLLIVQ